MRPYKIGEAIYIFNGISGEIMPSNYGGPCWQEKLGLISRNPAELRKWIATIKNENFRRIQDGEIKG